MNTRSPFVALLACLLTAAAAAPAFAQEAQAMPAKIVIGHRGASGYIPEHTLAGYAMSHGLGTDYIEPDVVLTKDGVFICLHDIRLEATTNVEQVFPDRKRADGKWYAADFTLEEIKRLRVHERIPLRFPNDRLLFDVPTFEEMIQLVQGLNKTTHREAGIYPELKEPSWHREQGLPMEEAFLKLVAQYGYTGKDAKIFVQCFEPETLKRLRLELKSELPQIMLLGDSKAQVTDEGLDAIAAYAEGIGPDKKLIENDPDVVKRAHAHHLLVHPYTVRREMVPKQYTDTQAELKALYFTYDCDGLFTDFPDTAVAVRNQGAR